MKKSFIGISIVITFICVILLCNNTQVKADELVCHIVKEYESDGVQFYVEGSQELQQETDIEYNWYVDENLVSSEKSYVLDIDDAEHWIKVEVKKEDTVICEDLLYYSKLPVVYINTKDGEDITSKTEYKDGTMTIQGNQQYNEQYNGGIKIKGRGNTSWWQYPQKPYKIKLNTSTDLFGFGKNKNWVLLSNYLDQSMMRNYTGQYIAKKLGLSYQNMTWVDVILNDEYTGCYLLAEQIRIGDCRIDIYDWENTAKEIAEEFYKAKKDTLTTTDRDTVENILISDLEWITSGVFTYNNVTYNISDYYDTTAFDFSGGYLFEMSYEYDEVSKFTTENGTKVMLSAPEYLVTNATMLQYVQDYWQSFENALISEDGYNSDNQHYSELADFDSMVSYWLTMEIMGNNDAVYKSRYSYKDVGNKLFFGPVWDFDWGCGSCAVGTDAAGWKVSEGTLWRDFIDDPYFCEKAAEKYWNIRGELEKIIKSDGILEKYYDSLYEAGVAMDKQYPITTEAYSSRRGYQKDCEIFKQYLSERIDWLDKQFATESSSVVSMCLTASTNPYTKSEDKIVIELENAGEDTYSEHLQADGLISKNLDLEMTVTVNDDLTKYINVYVNGIKNSSIQLTDLETSIIIDDKDLTEESYGRNVISIIGKDNSGETTYTNFVTVIQTDDYMEGVPYSYDGNVLTYDVSVPHVVINQVYGGSKKESYASHSFIELYNPTDKDIDLSSWSVQYRSSKEGDDSTEWSKLNLTGTIPSHCSYLIRCGSVKDPVEGAVTIDKFDAEWRKKLNNKGLSVVLMCNQSVIDADGEVFDNDTKLPVVSGYVDMLGVSGNDGTDTQCALYYENTVSAEQSKKKTIRRVAFRDTDDNSAGGDFEIVDYSYDDDDYIDYISPKYTGDGVWEYHEYSENDKSTGDTELNENKNDDVPDNFTTQKNTDVNSIMSASPNVGINVKIKATYKVPVKNTEPKKVTKVIKSNITLYTKKCRSAQLTAVVTGTESSVKWSTSNAKIVSVSSAGKVKAKRAGTAYVSATVGGQVTKIKVVVKKARIIVKLGKKKVGTKCVNLRIGKRYKLNTTSLPAGKVRYQSANDKIAKVSKNGKLTVLQSGRTYITVKCNGNSKKIKVKVG